MMTGITVYWLSAQFINHFDINDLKVIFLIILFSEKIVISTKTAFAKVNFNIFLVMFSEVFDILQSLNFLSQQSLTLT